MKRTARTLVLSTLVFLAACGGSSRTEVACAQRYWDGAVGTCLPKGWSVVPRETLIERGAPNDVAVAFQRDEAVSGLLPTVTVTREILPAPTDSATYSRASIQAVTALPNYKLIDSRPVTVDGQDVMLHIFTAQPMPDQPERRFYQVSALANGTTGYTFSALAPVSVPANLEQEIMVFMKNVTFKEATGEQSSG